MHRNGKTVEKFTVPYSCADAIVDDYRDNSRSLFPTNGFAWRSRKCILGYSIIIITNVVSVVVLMITDVRIMIMIIVIKFNRNGNFNKHDNDNDNDNMLIT